GWSDVLPYYRKLENELDFTGDLHGRDGPVPIRRTKPEDWAPLSKAIYAFAQERQIPFIADMNADFRDGYGAVPMSNWPHKRASAAICYLERDSARAQQPDYRQRCNSNGLIVRRPPRHRHQRAYRRPGAKFARARDHPFRRRRPLARIPDALGAGPGGAAARIRHRRARGSARCRRKSFQPRDYLHRPASAPQSTAGPIGAAAPDDRISLFLQPARRAADRHVHQRAVQDLVESAPLPGRQSRAHIAKASVARPSVAYRARCRAALRRIQLHRR